MYYKTYDNDELDNELNIVPGDIAVHDTSDAPGLDDTSAAVYAVVTLHNGEARLLSVDCQLLRVSPHEMARSADWYPCLFECVREHPRVHGA
jgi:hypothetical protein